MLAAAALAGIVFAVYAAGACPTIYVGDSGDLVTAVHVLGIPHPTGYPLYVLLGKLWSVLIPVGTVAWRMSLFSAVCAAAACGALYRLCRSLALHPVAAAFSALVLAFSPTCRSSRRTTSGASARSSPGPASPSRWWGRRPAAAGAGRCCFPGSSWPGTSGCWPLMARVMTSSRGTATTSRLT